MLQTLPFELLTQIVSELPSAQDISHLSQTNKALNRFFKDEGWKVFVQTRFPSIPVRQNYQKAAHSLTTTSRNWDRKAFLAHYVEPSNFIVKLPGRELETQWRKPRGQTMGYQPVIDSYEEPTGKLWDDRKQVLAWSAGSELVIRVKELGGKSLVPERRGTYSYFDHHGHRTRWFTYRPPKAVEGRDDITSLKVLSKPYRDENPSNSATEHAILGTASGKLFLSHLELDRSSNNTLGSVFETKGRAVRSADVLPGTQQVLAASLAETSVVLYRVPQYLYSAPEVCENVKPFCERSVLLDGGKSNRIWSTRFLSDGLLALGLGPSSKPVHVYQVTNDGLSKHPIRKLGIDATAWAFDNRVDTPEHMVAKEKQSSIYPIVPLPATASAGHSQGEVFLSGGYDGIIRLHDMRSPSPYSSTYFDPTDDASIYSLQTLGRERLVAGSSRHSSLKFWDLRVSGGRRYHYTDLSSTNAASQSATSRNEWNLFLNPRNQPQQQQRNSRWRDTRSTESPVYSLSSPSPTSPTLFAGVENNVVELSFISMLDKHPDPIYAHGLVRDQRGNINITRSWNPKGDVLNFAMYDHSRTGELRLKTQAGVGLYRGALAGFDERWRDGGSS
jgi:WD40 repeat protein